MTAITIEPPIKQGVRNTKKALFTSQTQTWKTPIDFYETLNKEFNFDFDPCPADRIIKAFGPLTSNFDGLSMSWGKRNFVNPPYSTVGKWIRKGYQESLNGKLSVFLVPSRTDNQWFHDVVLPYADEIRFIKGRLRFIDPQTNRDKDRAPFASCLIIFRPKNDLFNMSGENHSK